MRIYTRRGGGFGASFGLFGTILIALYYAFVLMAVGLLMIPFVAVLLIGALGAAGDGVLRAVPGYRRRRASLGPVVWYKTALSSSWSTINSMLNSVAGKRRRPARRTASRVRQPTPAQTAHAADRQRRADEVSAATQRKWEEEAAAARQRKWQIAIDMFSDLSPIDFAHAVGELFNAKGYTDVRQVAGEPVLTAVDAVARRNVVRCVGFAAGTTTGVAVVRDALPLLTAYGAQKLVVVSLNPFTAQAKHLAADSGIRLLDSGQLVSEVEAVGWLQGTPEGSKG